MTRFRHPLRWAAAGALAAAAALAQFAVIDVGAIAKAVEQIQTMTQQLEQISAFRQQMDAQVTAVTRPFTDLVALHDELTGTAFTLPPALGTAPAIGQRLEDRLAPIPGNAGYLQPPTPTAPQLQAALTPVAPDDPLVPDPADAAGGRCCSTPPDRSASPPLPPRPCSELARRRRSHGLRVTHRAGRGWGAGGGRVEDSWGRYDRQTGHALHTWRRCRPGAQSRSPTRARVACAGSRPGDAGQRDGLLQAAATAGLPRGAGDRSGPRRGGHPARGVRRPDVHEQLRRRRPSLRAHAVM